MHIKLSMSSFIPTNIKMELKRLEHLHRLNYFVVYLDLTQFQGTQGSIYIRGLTNGNGVGEHFYFFLSPLTISALALCLK